jgi:hypothetical protein
MDNEPTYFCKDAKLRFNGVDYALEEKDFEELSNDYWHGEGDPSTWLCASTVVHIRSKWKELPRAQVIKLASLVLGVSVDHLEEMLDWNAHYRANHDGSTPEACHVYPKEEK